MADGRARQRTGRSAGGGDGDGDEAARDDEESERRPSTHFVAVLFNKMIKALVDSAFWKACKRIFHRNRNAGTEEQEEPGRKGKAPVGADDLEPGRKGKAPVGADDLEPGRKGKAPVGADDPSSVNDPKKPARKKPSKHQKQVIGALKSALDKSDYETSDIAEALEQNEFDFLKAFFSLRHGLRKKLYEHFRYSGLTKNEIYRALKVSRMSCQAAQAFLDKELQTIVRTNLRDADVPDEKICGALKDNKKNALKATAILVREQVQLLEKSLDQSERDKICENLAQSTDEENHNLLDVLYHEKIYTVLDDANININEANSRLTGFGKQKRKIKKKSEEKAKVEIYNSRYSRTRLPSVSKYMEIVEPETPDAPYEDRLPVNEFTFESFDASIGLVYKEIEAHMIESYVRLQEVTHANLIPIKKISFSKGNRIEIGYWDALPLTVFPEKTIFAANGRLETYAFRSCVSCVIDGASCLHTWDMYHGNIQPSSVFVLKSSQGVRYLLGSYNYNHEMDLKEIRKMMTKDIQMIASFIHSMIRDHAESNEKHYELDHLCEILRKLQSDKKPLSLMEIKSLICGHPGMLPEAELADYITGAYKFLEEKDLLALLKDSKILSDKDWFKKIGPAYQDYLFKYGAVLSPQSGSDYIRTVYCCLDHRDEDRHRYDEISRAGDPDGLLAQIAGYTPVKIVTFFRNLQPKMVLELYKVAYGQGFNYIPRPFHEFGDGGVLVM